MEIRVKNVTKPTDSDFSTYTVNLEDHRILAAVTDSAAALCKWLDAVLRSPSNTRCRGITVVGVSVTEEAVYRHSIHILTLCVGSHSLLFLPPEPYDRDFKIAAKHLSDFFLSSVVKKVAFDSDRVADILRRHYNVEIENLFDIRYDVVAPELWMRSYNNGGGPYVDVRGLDLDELVAAVVGKDMEVVRPRRIQMFESGFYGCGGLGNNRLSVDMIKFSNLDAYLLFLIAYEFAHSFVHNGRTRFFSSFYRSGSKNYDKKKKKRKNKKNKNKKNEGYGDQSTDNEQY